MAVEAEDREGAQAELTGGWFWAAGALCVALSVFHLAVTIRPFVNELPRNAIHFGGFVLLSAMLFPAAQVARRGFLRWADLAFAAVVAAAAVHVGYADTAIYARGVRLTELDWIAGIIVVVGALEFSRRAAGPVIPILMILAISYVSWMGRHIPGVFNFRGLGAETVMFRTLYGDDAMFGTVATISATTVFPFIIFGAFLIRSGAGDFVIALARAVAGRLAGGPGLVAVIASSLTGTINGSAIANTASTGVITIPLMKKAGFKPRFAGGVEAAASTGGGLMPPIMGAGAFLMASYTNIPYDRIVAVALLPAILYFATVAFFVRIEARKLGLGAMPGEPVTVAQAFRIGGASFVIPIGVVVWMLLAGFSPSYAAVFGILACIASSWLTRSPMGPRAVVQALALGAKNMATTAVLLVSVGVIVNVIATAGIGATFSLMIESWAGGNVLVAIVLIALASLILGMGLPVTAAYIVLATLSAPALAGMISDGALVNMLVAGSLPQTAAPVLMLADPDAAMAAMAGPMDPAAARALIAGLPLEVKSPLRDMALSTSALTAALLSAHMIIYWLSQDSNVTPPVCLAAFTAAAIARAKPMQTAFDSWRLAKGLYIVPVLFAYTPILSGDPWAALQVFALALVGIYGVCAAMEGWMESRLPLPLRALAGVFGVAAVWPAPLWVELGGAAGVLAIAAWSVAQGRVAAARA
ncbi:MAG: TRAP transporter permease [Rubrimonas sp.]